jgi:asparagine synthase (glutamine-hydrolysing)
MNRLSILDVAAGNQPLFSEDNNLCIVYNGEVYNHMDLRPALEGRGHTFKTNCDTETVLKAFQEYGPKCLDMFNGMFAVAIWDQQHRRLFLGRDRLGIKPLYIALTPDSFLFASQPVAILPALETPEPDWTAISRYFMLGYIPSPDCAFDQIEKIPAGHYAWVENQSVEFTRYYTPSFGLGTPMPRAERLKELNTRLEQAVERELLSDVPLGLFLSGGLDSSAIAAYAARQRPNAMHSYALRFEEATHDESADARLVAHHLGLTHHELACDTASILDAFQRVSATLDEPFADATVLPLLILSEFARREVKVVLTGWGGDEIFAGYPTYRAHLLAAQYRRLPACISQRLVPSLVRALPVSDTYMSFEFKAKKFVQGMRLTPEMQHFRWMGYFTENELKGLFTPQIQSCCHGDIGSPLFRAARESTGPTIIDRILELDNRFFLEGNGLFQADRISMAASLEARVPLLNSDLVNWVNAIPANEKMHGGRLKSLLKDVMAQHLPPAIIDKPKKGFGPPTSIWLRTVFKEVLESVFIEEKIRQQAVFHYPTIRTMIDEHHARQADHGRKLWALLSFQKWYDRFFCEDHPK